MLKMWAGPQRGVRVVQVPAEILSLSSEQRQLFLVGPQDLHIVEELDTIFFG